MSTPSKTQTPTNKKIAKAAKAGTSKARTRTNVSWSYWGSVVGICVAGIALVVGSVIGKAIAKTEPFVQGGPTQTSLTKELQKLQSAKKPDAKKIAAAQKKLVNYQENSHWHSAYGFYNCDGYGGKLVGGKYVAEIDGTDPNAYPDREGIHAHDDGLLHIHPFFLRVSGRKAVLGRFLEAIQTKISSKEISYTGSTGPVKLNIDKMTCLDKKKKKVKPEISVFLWRNIKKPSRVERYTGDFARIPLVKNGAYAFAIAAPDVVPPVPPSEKTLEKPVDEQGAMTPAPEVTTNTAVTPASVVTATPSSIKVGAATTAKPAVSVASTAAPTTKKK